MNEGFFFTVLNKMLKDVKISGITLVKYGEMETAFGYKIPQFKIENPKNISYTIIALEAHIEYQIHKIARMASYEFNSRKKYFDLDDDGENYGVFLSEDDKSKYNKCVQDKGELQLKWRNNRNTIYTIIGRFGEINYAEILDEGVDLSCEFFVKKVFVDDLVNRKHYFVEDP